MEVSEPDIAFGSFCFVGGVRTEVSAEKPGANPGHRNVLVSLYYAVAGGSPLGFVFLLRTRQIHQPISAAAATMAIASRA